MKQLLTIILTILLITPTWATYYYFDLFSGNDSNDGLTSSTPKQTGTSLITYLEAASNGDVFYLKRGSYWYAINADITANITIRDYGDAADPNPVLYGSAALTPSLIGGNVYMAVQSVIPTKTSDRRYVTAYIDGDYRQVAQWPNDTTYGLMDGGGGPYFCYDAGASFTADEFIDGILVGKIDQWGFEYATITDNTTDGFSHNSSLNFNNAYYKVQNCESVADQDYEWWWRSDTIWVYKSGTWTSPNVRVSVIDTILVCTGNVNIYNVDVKEACFTGIYSTGTLTTRGCNIVGSCDNLIEGYYTEINSNNNYLAYAATAGILSYGFTGGQFDSSYYHKICYLIGMENRFSGEFSGACINLRTSDGTANPVIQYNIFDSCRIGVQLHNLSAGSYTVENNLFNYYGNTAGDVGAIYIGGETYNLVKSITQNFVLNASRHYGAMGTNWDLDKFAHGIYLDYNTKYFRVHDNVIENANCGLFNNGTYSGTTTYRGHRNNLLINAAKDISNTDHRVYYHSSELTTPYARYDTFAYNAIILDESTYTRGFRFMGDGNPIPDDFYITNNRYYVPYTSASHDVISLWTNYSNTYLYTVSEAQSATAYEDGSIQDATSRGSIFNLKNFSQSSHNFALAATYVDTAGNAVSGTVSVDAMSAKPLFYVSGTETVDPLWIDTLMVPKYTGSSASTGGGEPPTPTPGDTIGMVNFAYDSGFDVAGWTSLYGGGVQDSVEISTDIWLINHGTLAGGSSGETDGTPYPYLVALGYLYQTNVGTQIDSFSIHGLSDLYNYSFEWLSARNNDVAAGRTTYFTIGAETVSVDAVGNTTLLTIENVLADANGNITFKMQNTSGQYSYINGMVVTSELIASDPTSDTVAIADTVFFKDYYSGSNVSTQYNTSCADTSIGRTAPIATATYWVNFGDSINTVEIKWDNNDATGNNVFYLSTSTLGQYNVQSEVSQGCMTKNYYLGTTISGIELMTLRFLGTTYAPEPVWIRGFYQAITEPSPSYLPIPSFKSPDGWKIIRP